MSLIGPGPPDCDYHVGYMCFPNKIGAFIYLGGIIGIMIGLAIVIIRKHWRK